MNLSREWSEAEGDSVNFAHAGLKCAIRRVKPMGHLCGYVGVPPGHPLHGKTYGDIDEDFNVHGGLTYSDNGHAGYMEPTDWWWFGFDCAHSMSKKLPSGTYRNMAYVEVEAEVKKLAEQLAKVVK